MKYIIFFLFFSFQVQAQVFDPFKLVPTSTEIPLPKLPAPTGKFTPLDRDFSWINQPKEPKDSKDSKKPKNITLEELLKECVKQTIISKPVKK